MNLFLPYADAEECVRSLDDKRVNKMLLETAQILSTAIRSLDPETVLPVYKKTHQNHPVCVWTRESMQNYLFTLNYFKKLINEYEYRFSKSHKSASLLCFFESFRVADGSQTPFKNCTDFKSLEVHEAYRVALATKWANDKRKPVWTKRPIPNFFESVTHCVTI